MKRLVGHRSDIEERVILTVLIFAYNHEKYISKSISSVINQKCSYCFEIIVFDDASTDNTANIVKEFQMNYPDLVKVVINPKNLGLNETFENAVLASKGEYIAILAGDDYWVRNDKLQMQMDLLFSNKEIAYVHTAFLAKHEDSLQNSKVTNRQWKSPLLNVTGEKALLEVLCQNWSGYPLASSSCFQKAPLIEGLKKHPEILKFDFAGEGTILHASMSFYGGLYGFISIPTTEYLIRKKSLCHFETNSEQFGFSKQYYLLRLLVAKSFGLSSKYKAKIKRHGLFDLFRIALKLDTLGFYYSFLLTQKPNFVFSFFVWLSLKFSSYKPFYFCIKVFIKTLNFIIVRLSEVTR